MRGYVKTAGVVVFVLAFFLPAITMMESGRGSGSEPGWVCALVAIIAVGGLFKTGMQTLTAQNIWLALSGLVNPLVLIYLAFSFSSRFARLRFWLTIAIAAGLVSSWVFFCLAKFVPREGHVLWVLSIALFTGAEIVARRRAPSAELS
jgi:uncharacterized membrane protein YhaH (DUF805 family)